MGGRLLTQIAMVLSPAAFTCVAHEVNRARSELVGEAKRDAGLDFRKAPSKADRPP